MKGLKVMILFLVLACMVSTASMIVTCKKGMEVQQELEQVKSQRDTFRKALIKGNNDILKARKIIENKIHISI